MKCKYCKQKLQKYDCNKIASSYKNIPFLLLLFGNFFEFLRGAIYYKYTKERMRSKGVVLTCVNKDCINYLSDCKDKNLLGVES